jgi:hypothetical protein
MPGGVGSSQKNLRETASMMPRSKRSADTRCAQNLVTDISAPGGRKSIALSG